MPYISRLNDTNISMNTHNATGETDCIDTINGNLLHGEGDFISDGNICMDMCDRKNNNGNSANDLNN